MAANPETAADIAVHYWNSRVVARGHQLDVAAATNDINGGDNHLPERRAAIARWERTLTADVVAGLARGVVLLPSVRQRNGSDPCVARAQENLNKLDIPDAEGRPLTADGNLGPRTQHAIEAFLRQHGMPVDGKATPQLLAATQIAVSVTDALHNTQQFGQQYGVQPNTPPGWDGVPRVAQGQPARALRTAERIADTNAQFDGVRSRVDSTEEMQSERRARAPVATTATACELDRDSVAELQRDLNRLGFTDPRGRPLADDGHHGPNTQAAVMAFQREQGLAATGVADPTTLSAMNAHVIVASLQQQRDARDAQDAIQRQAQAFDAQQSEPKLHRNDPMNRESAMIHATRLPHANDFAGLRGTYTPPSTGQLAVEQNRPSVPGRDVDAIDHKSVRHGERGLVGFDAARGAAMPPEASRDARDPQHPDHAFYRAIADKLPAAYAQGALVAPGPEAQERVAASLGAQARSHGFVRADHVVIGGGEHGSVFVVQGRLDDPAHLRTHLPLQEAQRAPQQESFQQLQQASQQFAIDQRAQHERAQKRSHGSGMSM